MHWLCIILIVSTNNLLIAHDLNRNRKLAKLSFVTIRRSVLSRNRPLNCSNISRQCTVQRHL